MFVPVQFAPPAPCALLATPSPSGCAFLGRPRFFGCVAVVADFPNSPSRPWPFPGASDPDPALAAAAAAAADLSCFAEPVRARLGAVGTTPLGPMDDPGSASEAVPESSNPPADPPARPAPPSPPPPPGPPCASRRLCRRGSTPALAR